MTLYQHDGAAVFRFELQGDLKAELARELQSCWETARSTIGSRSVVVDVTGVSGFDDAGVRVLVQMRERGVRIESRGKNQMLIDCVNQSQLALTTCQVA